VADLTEAKQIPDLIGAAVRRFYSIDAVVNLLRPTAAGPSGSVTATSGVGFDELFDVLVRASFVVTREALPHLARSEGPRRIIALCQPPLALRDNFRPTSAGAAGAEVDGSDAPGTVLALARACQGLHLVGRRFRV
jgi:NAD(P)-dependent dehydrogenase (short-subunit alcohol dehydrogenase family)